MKQGVVCVGRQPVMHDETASTGCMSILNQNMHINNKRELVPLHESTFAWQSIGGPKIELVTGRNAPITVEVGSDITTLLE